VNDKEAQMPEMPEQMFGKGEGLSHNAAHALAQGEIEAFGRPLGR